jgi:hypothetical protein
VRLQLYPAIPIETALSHLSHRRRILHSMQVCSRRAQSCQRVCRSSIACRLTFSLVLAPVCSYNPAFSGASGRSKKAKCYCLTPFHVMCARHDPAYRVSMEYTPPMDPRDKGSWDCAKVHYCAKHGKQPFDADTWILQARIDREAEEQDTDLWPRLKRAAEKRTQEENRRTKKKRVREESAVRNKLSQREPSTKRKRGKQSPSVSEGEIPHTMAHRACLQCERERVNAIQCRSSLHCL